MHSDQFNRKNLKIYLKREMQENRVNVIFFGQLIIS